MKTIEFTEGELPDLDLIRKKLFEDENDPRSNAYVRQLNRPKIHWFRIACFVLLPIALSAALVFLLRELGLETALCVLVSAAILLIYAIVMMKSAAICVVKIYQRYAPDGVRNKCRFEPSCSVYMIQAIEKYGLLKGIKKGRNRLKRCNINGGGYDYP